MGPLPPLLLLVLAAGCGVARAQAQLNRAPHFLPGGDMARFALREDAAVGAPVYRLRGSDPEGATVHYSISGEWLAVGRESGVVTLRRELDRETVDIIEVIISITDEGMAGAEPNTVSLRREIPILDVNDNAPAFQGRPYSFSVAETTAVGTVLYSNISVTDADGGVNADVGVSCAPSGDDACRTFGVTTEKVNEGQFVVSITLLRPLDYEQQAAYAVPLLATDLAADRGARLTASANVVVDVVDVQDQLPAFLNAPYSATIPEGTAPGTVILKIRARDGDVGNSRPVRLTVEDDPLGLFALVHDAADSSAERDPAVASADLVTSAHALDREHPEIVHSGGIYTFTVRATELINNELPGDTATSQVTIIVTDVDDQMPTFNQNTFNINVSEDIGSDTPLPGINMVAHDRDVGENARFRLRLRNVRNAEGVFAVHPAEATGRTPVVIRVVDASRLDYDVEDAEKRTLAVDVVATVADAQGNEKEADMARVTINLLDANDNAPVFSSSSYRVRILEDTPPGSFVSNLTAMDRDSGEYGKVYYALRGFGAEKFYTDPVEGGLYVANGSRGLDYESRSSYSLTLEARDGGGRITTAGLLIEVGDVNDNKPTFEQKEYLRIVREGATSFEPQFFVRATDVDGPEQGGGKVFYSITSSNSDANVLFLEPISGEVKLNSAARAGDTPRGQYEIIVRTTDAGVPPLSDETRVLVRVGIPGNQRPIFRGSFNILNAPPTYNTSVKENDPPGTEIIQISATDPDGQDSLLAYFIAGGAHDNFAIDQSSGVITVAPEAHLDLETGISRYNVIVHAVDSGTPIRETGTGTVVVNIIDVNNKPPVFPSSDPSLYVRHISEATPVGEVILNVTANDPDSDAKLNYTLIEPIRAADRTGVALKSTVPFDFKTAFKINSTTGELSVAHQLEHDAAAVIVLTVEAEDLNALEGKQTTTVEITVHIQANEDNKPIFTGGGWTPAKPVVHIEVPEERPIGTTLITLAARDPITGSPISYYKQEKISENDLPEYVSVTMQTGDVVLTRRLDYENLPEKTLKLKVKAIAEERTSEATIIIDVQDINDNSPEFPQEMYTANVPESAQHPKPILTVQAKDGDADNNATGFGTVRYSLAGDNARMFVINSTTGVISVAPNATLDHEQYSTLRFSVIATDMPQGGANQRRSSAMVLVEVVDINDNAPSFGRASYSAVIPENVPAGTNVLAVTAADPDEGMGGEVNYELLDEGEANGLFTVDHITGRITTKRALTGKGRAEPYKMRMRAQDSGDPPLSSDVALDIYIGDVFSNDGVPTFVRPTLDDIAQISENSSIGSPVFQVIAIDPDDPNTPNGRITFKFLDGTDAAAFKIDPDTGLISTKKLLDREQKENYTLIIVAQDEGSPPQQATRLLPVRVLDVDDHAPLFQRGLNDEPVSMTVQEEVEPGTEIGYVEALDEDSGENKMIDYLIIYGNEDGLFNISRTDDNKGLLKVANRIDRESASEHLLTIKCFKRSLRPPSLRKSYNRQDPSEIQVHVKVNDIDDNKPKFSQENITIGVRLNVPVDTSLLTLEATDNDALAAPISYHLLNTTFFSLAPSVIDIVSVPADQKGTFRLNNQTGELRTAGSMLPYADGFFELHIVAMNTENPAMEAYATVKVFVLRDRDLLKFVFNKPPTDVRRDLEQFQKEVEQALLIPVSLNVYDTQFYAKEDGSLDFSSTSSCFQLVGKESYDLGDMESLMKDFNNADLFEVYKKYGVQSVHHCAPIISAAEASWVQLWVLAIAAFIGIGALVAGITTCCLYSRYKKLSKKALLREMPHVPISNIGYISSTSGSPPMIITAPTALSDGPRMYDGLTLSTSHDNMSYHSFPR